jgi:thioredoxin reductase (NADPH)
MATEVATPAALDPDDPYAREAQTFPRLDADMIRRVSAYGVAERMPKGALLFRRGERSVDFFVVDEGCVEIFYEDAEGRSQVVRRHGPHEFTGELDLFSDRSTLVSGRAAEDSRVLRIKRAEFRHLVTGEPDIGEIVMRAFILRRVGLIKHEQGGAVLIGPGRAGDTLRLQRFLSLNAHPFRLFDTEHDPDAGGFLECFALRPDQLPVVILPGRHVLKNPSNARLADELGLTEPLDPHEVYDVAVVGAGPAGLAAAVYAASEGLSTIVVEGLAPGGQAATSSKIENYLGFPTGISGQALAGRARVQAQKFGARLSIARPATALDCAGEPYRVQLEEGPRIAARAVVIATGARYRKLDVANYEKFEGAGIHYAATAMEARLCAGEEVALVGGGNSAGQAAVFLSRTVRRVHLLIRGTGLAATMSNYLIQRIITSPVIAVHARTEVTGLDGDPFLRRVQWTNRDTGVTETHDIANLFVMIGAEPNTEWLNGCLDLDEKGFIETGRLADRHGLTSPYAASKPGVFAVGDVRANSVKRVASSVGEGSVVIHAIHRFLQADET